MKRTTTAKKIIDVFLNEYEEKFGTKYLVNFPMIKTAEKVAQFYTLAQISQAIAYYFDTYSKNDLWDFLNNVDKYVRSAAGDAIAQERLSDLIEKTKRRLNAIEHGASTDNQDIGNQRDIEGD